MVWARLRQPLASGPGRPLCQGGPDPEAPRGRTGGIRRRRQLPAGHAAGAGDGPRGREEPLHPGRALPRLLAGNFTELESVLAEHLGLEASERRLVAVMREPCRPRLGIRARPARRGGHHHRRPHPGHARVETLERGGPRRQHGRARPDPGLLDVAWSKLAELLTTHIEAIGRGGRLVPLSASPASSRRGSTSLVSLDCTREELWPGAVARLRQHLRRDERPPDPEQIACPYPGMVAYGRDQAESSSAGPARSPTSAGGSRSRAW